MELNRVNHLEQIPPEDWGKTPASVKKLKLQGHFELRPSWCLQLGQLGTSAIMLGASATGIYQNLGTNWSIGRIGNCTGQTAREVV
jgi:hypothetical protein